jgi:hypothetical protein
LEGLTIDIKEFSLTNIDLSKVESEKTANKFDLIMLTWFQKLWILIIIWSQGHWWWSDWIDNESSNCCFFSRLEVKTISKIWNKSVGFWKRTCVCLQNLFNEITSHHCNLWLLWKLKTNTKAYIIPNFHLQLVYWGVYRHSFLKFLLTF